MYETHHRVERTSNHCESPAADIEFQVWFFKYPGFHKSVTTLFKNGSNTYKNSKVAVLNPLFLIILLCLIKDLKLSSLKALLISESKATDCLEICFCNEREYVILDFMAVLSLVILDS
jgi:hypothetical protein